jgi:hypothetical protein
MSPVHTTPSYLSKINVNILHLTTSFSSKWTLSFWLSHQYPIFILLFPMCATYPACIILLDVIVLIIFGEESIFEAPYYSVSSNLIYLIPLCSETKFHMGIKYLLISDHFG